jgi:hypothetical protein
VFYSVNPAYLQELSPLVILTIAAVITNPLENRIPERLSWLDTALGLLNPRVNALNSMNPMIHTNLNQSPDLDSDLLPRILGVIKGRLQDAYMKFSEANPTDPALRIIAQLSRRATELETTHHGIIHG